MEGGPNEANISIKNTNRWLKTVALNSLPNPVLESIKNRKCPEATLYTPQNHVK
jgi:hypothetical protein